MLPQATSYPFPVWIAASGVQPVPNWPALTMAPWIGSGSWLAAGGVQLEKLNPASAAGRLVLVLKIGVGVAGGTPPKW